MINDYIDIANGEVIDLGLEIDLIINKNENPTDIIKQTITNTINFFSIDGRKMGDPLFVGDLIRQIGQIQGVVNVIDIRVYNQIGGLYSSSEVAQSYSDNITKEIQQIDNVIFMKSNQIYQIRFPNTDIRVRTKTTSSTTY